MKVIVLKFGGTSVATDDARQRLVARTKHAAADGLRPVIVVSAMGRGGEPYATDTLIGLARKAYPEPDPRELDLMMSCGEIISAVVVSGTLRSAGIDAVAMTGAQAGIFTDGAFGNSRIVRVDPARIIEELERNRMPVVAGFQGVTDKGEITTLGRGGSDTTAVALGASLGALSVEIFTDVDGIKTADPRVVPHARTISKMSYDEISQMAHEGAKVIHPRAVEIAMRHNVPLRIRSTFDDTPGTLVSRTQGSLAWPESRNYQVVTGVTHVTDLCRVSLLNGTGESPPLTSIFRKLAEGGVSIDMISVSEDDCSFVIKEDVSDRTDRILKRLGLGVDMRRNCAKVSIVGAGMRGVPGVMANVAEALHDAGVNILQTSDSHVTISCLISHDNLQKAAQALHSRFGLDEAAQ
jgi:aspartate kinase